jgi:hypothetical protein
VLLNRAILAATVPAMAEFIALGFAVSLFARQGRLVIFVRIPWR